AAHTGRRRRELLPERVEDIDFEAKWVLLREKERKPLTRAYHAFRVRMARRRSGKNAGGGQARNEAVPQQVCPTEHLPLRPAQGSLEMVVGLIRSNRHRQHAFR